jgi:hypothetical protein
VRGFEKSREKGGADGDSELNEVLASQVIYIFFDIDFLLNKWSC